MSVLDINNANVSELEQAIRGYINDHRMRKRFTSDTREFDRLCSALDAVGDAEYGIDAFLKMEENGEPGVLYIALYGLLQILYVEQDAVVRISEFFSMDGSLPRELQEIRTIRNRSIGHPVPNQTKSPAGFISRAGLSLRKFDLMQVFPDRSSKIESVDTHDLIVRQRKALTTMLTAVLKKLRDDELSHRKMHRDRKLTDMLHKSLPYLLSKIGAAEREEEVAMGVAALASISEMASDVRTALTERGLSDIAGDLFERLFYAIDELEKYYADTDPQKLNGMDTDIFAVFIEGQISRLRGLSEEVDNEYESDEILH